MYLECEHLQIRLCEDAEINFVKALIQDAHHLLGETYIHL